MLNAVRMLLRSFFGANVFSLVAIFIRSFCTSCRMTKNSLMFKHQLLFLAVVAHLITVHYQLPKSQIRPSCKYSMGDLHPVYAYPCCLQTTVASGLPQKSSHTVPQTLLTHTSTLPSYWEVPPTSRTSP